MVGIRAFYTRYLEGTPLGYVVKRNYRAARDVMDDTWLGTAIWGGHRAKYALGYYLRRMKSLPRWLWYSRETSNFTYDLTAQNKDYLAAILAVAVKCAPQEIASYITELEGDEMLRSFLSAKIRMLPRRYRADAEIRYGRRLGWYAAVRALKPKVVVETGVDKGLGAAVLCAALLKNEAEGHPGRYYGTDVNPEAGYLLDGAYRRVGVILYADSIESLERLSETVDLFINDSDHSAEYEGREYRTIARKLSSQALILGDNAHVTDELLQFSLETDRHFIFFREDPRDHWYLGAGIGISFN